MLFFKNILIIGNTIKHGMIPILKILAPSASKPPSAKIRHCITKTDAIVNKAGNSPSNIASKIPPPI